MAVRETSCSCRECLGDVERGCKGWQCYELRKNQNIQTETNKNKQYTEDSDKAKECEQEQRIQPSIGDYVAAAYQNQWYIRKVIEFHNDEANTDFLERAGKVATNFKWPALKDKLWIPVNDILLVISQPTKSGKSQRLYKLSGEIVNNIEICFRQKNIKHNL